MVPSAATAAVVAARRGSNVVPRRGVPAVLVVRVVGREVVIGRGRPVWGVLTLRRRRSPGVGPVLGVPAVVMRRRRSLLLFSRGGISVGGHFRVVGIVRLLVAGVWIGRVRGRGELLLRLRFRQGRRRLRRQRALGFSSGPGFLG